jgi:hypothetical protein
MKSSGEPLSVPTNLLVQPLRRNAIELGEVRSDGSISFANSAKRARSR